MILFKWFIQFRYNKYKHELIDLCLINSAHINQRWSITYHSIISFILKNKSMNSLLFIDNCIINSNKNISMFLICLLFN